MPLYALTDKQLNYFKFAAIVLDEFPKALRQTFVSIWNNRYGGPPTNQPWDDTVATRNQLKAKEGGSKCKIPTHLSYKAWDCSALFKTTIFAHSFEVPDAHGTLKTLSEMYVRPLHLPSGTFHTTVKSSTGDQNETYALAIDQLRLLRNTVCHQDSTQNIDKLTFDRYAKLAKDAIRALGLNTATIDNIRGLKQEDFPTKKVQRLQESLTREKDAMIEFLQIDVVQGIEDLSGKMDTRADEMKSELRDTGRGMEKAIEAAADKTKEELQKNREQLGSKMAKADENMEELKESLDDLRNHVQQVLGGEKESQLWLTEKGHLKVCTLCGCRFMI